MLLLSSSSHILVTVRSSEKIIDDKFSIPIFLENIEYRITCGKRGKDRCASKLYRFMRFTGRCNKDLFTFIPRYAQQCLFFYIDLPQIKIIYMY